MIGVPDRKSNEIQNPVCAQERITDLCDSKHNITGSRGHTEGIRPEFLITGYFGCWRSANPGHFAGL